MTGGSLAALGAPAVSPGLGHRDLQESVSWRGEGSAAMTAAFHIRISSCPSEGGTGCLSLKKHSAMCTERISKRQAKMHFREVLSNKNISEYSV